MSSLTWPSRGSREKTVKSHLESHKFEHKIIGVKYFSVCLLVNNKFRTLQIGKFSLLRCFVLNHVKVRELISRNLPTLNE